MKQKFRLYQRGSNGRFYLEDNTTGKQESLGTSDRVEAERLFHARNEAEYQPSFNAHMARAYLVAKDALISKRTWQFVMDEMKRTKVKHAERRSDTRARRPKTRARQRELRGRHGAALFVYDGAQKPRLLVEGKVQVSLRGADAVTVGAFEPE